MNNREKSHLIIGIDIGSNSTRVCAVNHFSNRSTTPEIVDLVEIPTEGIYKGNITDEKGLANTVSKAITALKIDIVKKRPHIMLSLNAAGINSASNNTSIVGSNISSEITRLDIERLDREAQISVANIKNKKVIHSIPIRYKLDHQEIQGLPIGMFGKRLEGKFLFVFAPVLYIEKIENIFSSINLPIEDTVVGPFAELIPLLNKKQRIAGTALINIGHSTTSILVYENDNPILTSILGIGSNDITNDIALGLQISLEDADKIKLGKSDIPYSKRKLEEIIDARIEFICEKINLEFDKINRRGLLPGGIVLTGNGSKLGKIEFLLKEYLKLPIRFADNEIKEFSEGQLSDSSYARVYGITFLAPSVSPDYTINKFFKKLGKNVSDFLKKLLP
ncbi:MAG: cell division FtsA domain-containing protein [Candidatus Nomurabacteria bacterium]